MTEEEMQAWLVEYSLSPRHSVWVIAHDGGCEGFSGPIQAFVDKDTATKGLRIMEAGGAIGVVLFEVPVWPNVQTADWWNIQPLRGGSERDE